MEQKTETIVTTAPFNAGKTETILVRLAGYITEIVFRFGLNVAQTSEAAAVVDGILRMIDGLKFTASNVLDWYTIRDGREGFYLDYIKTQGSPYAGDIYGTTPPDLPAGAQEARDVEVQFVFHPGIMPGNPFDLTRCIPLRGKSNVQVEVSWGTVLDDLGAGYSIDTAASDGLSIEVSRVILEPGETERQAFAPLNHIFVPRLLPVTYPIDAKYDAFSFSLDVLTGAYIRDVMFLVVDSAEIENRSSGELNQFRVRNNKGELYNVRRNWIGFEREIKRRYYLPAVKSGLAMLDFRGVKGKDYGLNMVQASKGDWMLEFSTARSGGEIWALYEAADLVSIDPTVIGL